jgi:hypothetical protein
VAPLVDVATERDALTVIARKGRLSGRVARTLAASAPRGITPVGVDLNATNAVVAMEADGREFVQSGKATKGRNAHDAGNATRTA